MKFFKKAKVENTADFESMMVELPKSKQEATLSTVVNGYDELMAAGGYANGEHKVKVGEEEMTVNELVKRHLEMKNKMGSGEQGEDAKADGDAGLGEDVAKNEDKDGDEDDKKKNEKKDGEEENAKKNADDEAAAKKAKEEADAKKKENFEKLKNAPMAALQKSEKIETSDDKLARGKARYGSN